MGLRDSCVKEEPLRSPLRRLKNKQRGGEFRDVFFTQKDTTLEFGKVRLLEYPHEIVKTECSVVTKRIGFSVEALGAVSTYIRCEVDDNI